LSGEGGDVSGGSVFSGRSGSSSVPVTENGDAAF
jgi:hypothetical protein